MMYMTNDEYKHYIFEQKRKGRSEEQIAESMGMQLEDFLALQSKVFGNPIAETDTEPETKPVAEPEPVEETVVEAATEPESEPETIVESESEPESEPVVVDFVNPLFQAEPAPVIVEEDESWAD